MERLYQDREFTVDSIAGGKLLNLIKCSDADNDADHPILFYAKFSNDPHWHKFFLDLSAAFWDIVSDDHVEESLLDESYIFTHMIEGMTLTVVEAFAFVPDGTECAGIDILFDDARRFVVRCVHDTDGHHTEARLIG